MVVIVVVTCSREMLRDEQSKAKKNNMNIEQEAINNGEFTCIITMANIALC